MKFLHVALLLLLGAFAAPRARADEAARLNAIPDVEVQDQTGRTLHFRRDLLEGKTVVVNFLFTGCSTICPQLGAGSAAVARALAAKPDDRLRVISISFDPGADTPERLREWSANFGEAPGWTLVTGKRRDIEALLRAFQVYTSEKTLHSENYLLGNVSSGEWRRVPGSTTPAKIAGTLRELAGPAVPAAAPAASYFPDVVLLNQDGESRRFYTDLVKGRIVVINTIFSDCGAVCPLMAERFAKIQTQLGDRVGRDVFLLSISVDPVTDTPEKLRTYATHLGAKPGWQFLTGEKSNIDLVLKKLGQYVESRDAHSNIVIIGNEPTGLWKKAFGLAAPEEVIRVVESVANDRR
jgi:protein SCO1/2